MRHHHSVSSSGFTLIEILIVVAIIGIISAIAIPNLINAVERARQARTIMDLRTLSQGVEIYLQDAGFYPRLATATATDLGSFITAAANRVPQVDAWRNPMRYQSDSLGAGYTLFSYGRNGVVDTWVPGPSHCFDDDIVIGNGFFYQWPEGRQTD